MTESRDRSTPSRREFLRLAAAAGLAGTLPATAAFAQSAAPAPRPTQLPAPVPPVAPAAPVSPVAPTAPAAAEPPSEAARALTAILQQRFGKDRLTPEQWESVTKDFDGDMAAGRRLAATKLANGDEPDFSFFLVKD